MKAGKPSLDVTSLAAFLKRTAKLASFKAPTSVFIWHEPELPRGATGKILKKDVRSYFAAAKPRSKL